MKDRFSRRNFVGNAVALGAAGAASGAPVAAAPKGPPKFVSVTNVKRFGAKGNGKHDDTRAIRRAIAQGNRSRNAVYFPAGTYITSAPLECPPETMLLGAGPIRSIIKASKKFKFPNDDTAMIRSHGAKFGRPAPSRRLTMSGIKVDGDRVPGSNGILVSPQQPAYFENVRADKCLGYGMAVVDCQQMVFRNIELIDNGIGLVINSGEFLFFYDLNIERSKHAYVRLQRQSPNGETVAIRNQSIHFIGVHMEQSTASSAPFFDVRSGRGLLFQNNYFSARSGAIYKFSSMDSGTPEQGHTYVIVDAQTAGSPEGVSFISDASRGLNLNAFDDFRSHIPMFIAPQMNPDPFTGPSL